jgi:repressor LexA
MLMQISGLSKTPVQHLHRPDQIRTFVRMDDFDLTPNQRRVLDCIRRHVEHNGSAPTLREISEYLGLSSHSSAQDYVEALIRKGALERSPRHRGLRLAHRSRTPAAASLPLVGRVAAGSPIMSEGNVEAQFAIDPALFRPRADFLLRVAGMSMRDAGIIDGDLLAVHRAQTADDGRIVVARLDDEITVKRLKHRNGRLLLLPENPDFSPIEVDPRRTDSFAIEGVYVGIIRRS